RLRRAAAHGAGAGAAAPRPPRPHLVAALPRLQPGAGGAARRGPAAAAVPRPHARALEGAALSRGARRRARAGGERAGALGRLRSPRRALPAPLSVELEGRRAERRPG